MPRSSPSQAENPGKTTSKAAGLPGLVGAAAAIASALFFGLNAVASKILYSPASPAGFDAVGLFVARGVWALPLFLVLALATRPPGFRPTAAQAGLFALCGLAFGPGSIALSALGAQHTSASHAVMLLSLFPPLASGLAAILLREKLQPQRLAGIALGVAGAVVLAGARSSSGASLLGDALIAGFILTWALLTVGVRQLAKAYPPLFVAGAFGVIGCLMLVAIALLLGRLDAAAIPLRHFDWRTVVWFDLELVLLMSVGGQLLQALALKRLDVSVVVALTSYGSIAFGLLASVMLLGERFTPSEVVAGALLAAALSLSLAPARLFRPRGRRTTAAG